MSTQIERSSATRSKILAIARAAFVRDGYEGASLEKIAAEAGFTKGALYHHYDGKAQLFAAVFSLVSQETLARVSRRAAKTGGPRERLKAVAIAWLKAVEHVEARTILLELGPEALGFTQARALEDSITLEPLRELVRAVIEDEQLKGAVSALLAARLINAALSEIALLRQASGGRDPSAQAAAHAIGRIIDGLLSEAPRD